MRFLAIFRNYFRSVLPQANFLGPNSVKNQSLAKIPIQNRKIKKNRLAIPYWGIDSGFLRFLAVFIYILGSVPRQVNFLGPNNDKKQTLAKILIQNQKIV